MIIRAIIQILLTIIFPIFAIISLGFFFGRGRRVDSRSLSRITIYILSPCLIFTNLSQSTLSVGDLGQIVSFVLLTVLVMAFLSWGVGRALKFDRATESAFLLATLFVNSGNYGLPLNLLAFGEEGLARAIIFFATSSFLINTLAVYLASRGHSGVRGSIANVFKFPLIYAVVAALTVNFVDMEVPAPLFKALEITGEAAIPVLLLALGIELSQSSVKEKVGVIGLATFMRLVVGAGVALGIASLMGLEGVTRQACVVEASMPTAVLTAVLAVEFEAQPEFVTGAVFSTTLASVLTLTLLLHYLL